MGGGTRILLVGDYPPPHGGIAVHVQQLHAALPRRGFQSRVLNIGRGGAAEPGVIPVRTKARLTTELLRHARRGWTVHLHTSGNNVKSWSVVLGVASLARTIGAPAVVTLHSGLLPEVLRRSARSRLLARTALAGFVRIIAVSQAIRDSLRSCGVPDGRIRVYPTFCAAELRPGRPPEGFLALRASHSPLIALAHHPSPVYGRALMLDALSRLLPRHPDAGLAVFGPGTEDPELEADAGRFGVLRHVHVLGELPHDQALAVIERCDVFVRPTLADGDSISVREALALGTRCVASAVSPRPDGTFLFRPCDPDDLAARIEVALGTARSPWPQPDVVDALEQLYRELDGAPRRRSTPFLAQVH